MPKRKFRRALIFITLLMIVTALTIFQSPEYEKNYGDLESYENLAGEGDLAGMATCTSALKGTSKDCPIILKQGTDVQLNYGTFYKAGTKVFVGSGQEGTLKKIGSNSLQFSSTSTIVGSIQVGVVREYNIEKGGKLFINDFGSQVATTQFNDELNPNLKQQSPQLFSVLSDTTLLESAKIKAAQAVAQTGKDITQMQVLGFKSSEHKIPASAYGGGTILYQEGTSIGAAPGEKKAFETNPTVTAPTYTNYITPTGKKIYQCDGKPCVEIGGKYLNIPTGVNIPAKHESTELYGFFTSGGISDTPKESSDAQVLYVVANDQQLDSIDTKYKTSGSYTGNVIVQETNGAYSLLTVTPVSTPYQQKVVKVGSKYGVIGENGVIYPLAQQVFATTSGVVVVGENGQGKEYFSSNEQHQGQPVLSDGSQLFKYDASTNSVVHVTGTITYSDGSLAQVSSGNVEYTLTPTKQKTTDGKTVYTKTTKTPAAITLAGTGAGTPPSSEVYDESGVPITGKVPTSNGFALYQGGKLTGDLQQTNLGKGEQVVYLQQNPDGSFKKKADGSFQTFNANGEVVSPTATGTYFSQFELDKIYDMIYQTLTERGMPKSKEDINKLLPSLDISVTGDGEFAVSGGDIGEPIKLKGLSASEEPTKFAVATDLTVSEEPLWISELSSKKKKQQLLVQEQVEQLEEGITISAQNTGYTTATGKPVFVYNNKYYVKIGEHYELIPQGVSIPAKRVDSSGNVAYTFMVSSGTSGLTETRNPQDAFFEASSKKVDISGASIIQPEGAEPITFDGAVLAQVAQGQYGFVGVTPTNYQAVEGEQIFKVFKVGDSYTTLDDKGNFYPITQGTLQYGYNFLIIKKGQGTEYAITGGNFKEKPVVKAADGTYYTYDTDTKKLKKFSSGTVTYSDGIGIIKKGEETRLYERTTDDGETFYTQSSAVTIFSQKEQTYDAYGKLLKNAVVKISGIYYAYDPSGAVQVVSNVGATDEYGQIVYWDSKNGRFINTDGSSADGMTITYTDQHGQSQEVTLLSHGLLPQQMTPPLVSSKPADVPQGVTELTQTIQTLNQIEGKTKATDKAVVEALKQAGADVTLGKEEEAVKNFQSAWILQNCGDDGNGCTDTCIGKSVNNICTADGIVGSKTIAALSDALQKKKASLYAAQQPEEESKKIGVEVSESGGENVYTFTNTKGETMQIPTDVYQGLLQKMEKRDNNPQGILTNEQLALLYDVMSQQHPDKMNLDDLKCSASSCYVDKKDGGLFGWGSGDIIYTVEEVKGRQVVKVYNGADGSDFDKEKGKGYKSLTYYNFEGNYLTQVSSIGEDGVLSIYSPSGSGKLEKQDRVLKFKDNSLNYFHADSAWHGEYVGTDTDSITGKPLTHTVKITSDGQIYLDGNTEVCSGSGLCQQIKDQYEPLIEHIQADPKLNTLVSSAQQFGATPLPESLPQPQQGEAQVGPPVAVKAAEQIKLNEVQQTEFGAYTITKPKQDVDQYVVEGQKIKMTQQGGLGDDGSTSWKLEMKGDVAQSSLTNPDLKKAISGTVTVGDDGKIKEVKDSSGTSLCNNPNDCEKKFGGKVLGNLLEGAKKVQKAQKEKEEKKKAAKAQPAPAPAPAEQPSVESPPPAPPKPYTPPKNVAGLDIDGSVLVCDNAVTDPCDPQKASFTFSHESILDGVEGSVYVKDKADKSGKELCTQGTDGCEKKNCKDEKGCKQTSDGDKYCTEFLGKSSCVNDPLEVTEHFIEECAKDSNYKSGTSTCAGAEILSSNLYQSLDFEFRSRVEVVFGSLFDKWSNNAFSRLEYWMYDSICHMNYYDAGSSEVDLIAGGTITQEHNFAHNLSYLGPNEIIVTLGGEKEEVNGTIYRYAFSIQTIGPVHGVVYLYNKCTQKKSFSTTGTGWKDEFVVNNPLGVHRNHYATDQLTFDCDMEGIEECRFDHACLKILDNDDYVAPLCQKLEGDEIILNPETKDTDCGNVASTALGFKK